MKRIFKILGVLSTVVLGRLVPFNMIIGSQCAMFSWSTVFAPVIALQCGLSWVLSFVCSKTLFTTASLSLFLLHRLPLLVASYSFVKRNVLTSLLVPFVCISLFVVHSVGSQAWLYAMYWLIPMGLYFVQDTQWSRALTASFIAHGIGSVVYLYTGSISAEVWMALIPLVACERLLMSVGMVAMNKLCVIFAQLFRSKYKVFSYFKAV